MDSKERSSVERLEKHVSNLTQQVHDFQSQVTTLVTALQSKVDAKHVPINLEQDILSVMQSTFHECIKKVLTDYNSPLPKYVTMVMSRHEKTITDLLDTSFTEAFKKEDFVTSVKEGIAHKAARTLVSVGEGALDKATNDLKQNPAFRAKAVLMLTELAKEFVVEKK